MTASLLYPYKTLLRNSVDLDPGGWEDGGEYNGLALEIWVPRA